MTLTGCYGNISAGIDLFLIIILWDWFKGICYWRWSRFKHDEIHFVDKLLLWNELVVSNGHREDVSFRGTDGVVMCFK